MKTKRAIITFDFSFSLSLSLSLVVDSNVSRSATRRSREIDGAIQTNLDALYCDKLGYYATKSIRRESNELRANERFLNVSYPVKWSSRGQQIRLKYRSPRSTLIIRESHTREGLLSIRIQLALPNAWAHLGDTPIARHSRCRRTLIDYVPGRLRNLAIVRSCRSLQPPGFVPRDSLRTTGTVHFAGVPFSSSIFPPDVRLCAL